MTKTCAFTGHRFLPEDFDTEKLENEIENLIKKGVNRFLCGMAVGFDMLCAEIVIKLKEKYDLTLVACIPCEGQSVAYSAANKDKYAKILSRCDEKTVLAPGYSNGCMQKRNRYMVDNSDVILCYLTKHSGGTYYTVNYAKTCGNEIIKI